MIHNLVMKNFSINMVKFYLSSRVKIQSQFVVGFPALIDVEN